MRDFDLLNEQEQHLFAWKIMRCIETDVPRNISAVSSLFAIMQAILEMPPLEEDVNYLPKMTDNQKLSAIVCTLAVSNLMKTLYSHDARNNGGQSIINKIVKVFDDEKMSTDGLAHTLLRISECLCQEFINGKRTAN